MEHLTVVENQVYLFLLLTLYTFNWARNLVITGPCVRLHISVLQKFHAAHIDTNCWYLCFVGYSTYREMLATCAVQYSHISTTEQKEIFAHLALRGNRKFR